MAGSVNSSNNRTSVFNISVYDQKYWIECEVLLSVLTVIAVYVFVCISIYASKKKAKPTREIGGGKQGKRLYLMLVLASGLAVLRMISDHVVAFTSSYSDNMCFGTIAVSTVLYASGLFSVYLFLWMRQNIFYANPVLSKVLNKAVAFLSWCCLVLMVISAVCLTVLYNVPYVNGWDYQVTEDGCKGVLIANGEVVAGLATAATTTFQVLLLMLFVYPLISRKTQRYRSAGNKGTSSNCVSHVSASNTDDNITDGENSSAQSDGKSKIVKSQNSENESGVDVSSSGDSPQMYSKCPDETSRNESIVSPSRIRDVDKGNRKFDVKSDSPKKQNILSKFQNHGKIFYRRNPNAIVDEKTQDQNNSDNCVSSSAATSQKDHQPVNSTGNKDKKAKYKRSKTQQGRRMMAFLKKAFLLMVICIITDIVSTVVQAQINLPEIVYLVIFDINLMLNIICIVMSFRDWDVILFPLCSRCKITNRHRTEYNGSSGAESHKAEHRRHNSSSMAAPPRAQLHVPQGAYVHREYHFNDHNVRQLDLNGKT